MIKQILKNTDKENYEISSCEFAEISLLKSIDNAISDYIVEYAKSSQNLKNM